MQRSPTQVQLVDIRRLQYGSELSAWLFVVRHRPDFLRYLVPRWLSRIPGRTPITDRRPWMTYPAVNWLQRRVRPGMRVFEWGMGGSTMFFLNTGAHVTSVEHDAAWHDVVTRYLRDNGLAEKVD